MKLLNTERLMLRGFKESDLSDIYEYCSQKDVVDMVGMRLHTSLEVTSKYISHETSKAETYGIVLKDNQKLIGSVSLRPQENDENLDIRLISCIINPLYWGNGYAVEAISAYIEYAFEELNVYKILGGHYSFNTQSASVNKKLGFLYEGIKKNEYMYKGEMVDLVKYGLLRSEYISSKKTK